MKEFALTYIFLLLILVGNAQTNKPKVKLTVRANKDSVAVYVEIFNDIKVKLPSQTIIFPKGVSYPATGMYKLEKKFNGIYKEQKFWALIDGYPLLSPLIKVKSAKSIEKIDGYYNLNMGDYRIKATIFFLNGIKILKTKIQNG